MGVGLPLLSCRTVLFHLPPKKKIFWYQHAPARCAYMSYYAGHETKTFIQSHHLPSRLMNVCRSRFHFCIHPLHPTASCKKVVNHIACYSVIENFRTIISFGFSHLRSYRCLFFLSRYFLIQVFFRSLPFSKYAFVAVLLNHEAGRTNPSDAGWRNLLQTPIINLYIRTLTTAIINDNSTPSASTPTTCQKARWKGWRG